MTEYRDALELARLMRFLEAAGAAEAESIRTTKPDWWLALASLCRGYQAWLNTGELSRPEVLQLIDLGPHADLELETARIVDEWRRWSMNTEACGSYQAFAALYAAVQSMDSIRTQDLARACVYRLRLSGQATDAVLRVSDFLDGDASVAFSIYGVVDILARELTGALKLSVSALDDVPRRFGINTARPSLDDSH